jgi:hypothetical protein
MVDQARSDIKAPFMFIMLDAVAILFGGGTG